jgi:SSS family solute:Na+ symporter
MLVDTPVTLNKNWSYPEGSFFWIVNNINFQYFSILITIVSAIVMVVVSYMTAAPDDQKITGLTFATASGEDRAKTFASWDWRDVVSSCIVLAAIIGAYLYFRG